MMKKENYKKHLDKISCSDDFRKKMEAMLSSEPAAIVEYDDAVTTVERADRINIRRWGSLAASLVLLIGIGGAAVHMRNTMPDINTGNDDQNSIIIATETIENTSTTTAGGGVSSVETTTTAINNEDESRTELPAEKDTTADENETVTEADDDVTTSAAEETETETSKVTAVTTAVSDTTSANTQAMTTTSVQNITMPAMSTTATRPVPATNTRPSTTRTKLTTTRIITEPDMSTTATRPDAGAVPESSETNTRPSSTTATTTTTTATTTTTNTNTDTELAKIIQRYMTDKDSFEQLTVYSTLCYQPTQEDLQRVLYYYCEYDEDSVVNDALNVFNSCTWTATNKSDISGESIVIGGTVNGFNFTRNGYMKCGETDVVYKAKSTDVSKLNDLFDRIVNTNDQISLQHRLLTKAKYYNNFEADVKIKFDKKILDMNSTDIINIKGKIYYENYFMENSVDSYGKYYYSLNGTNSDYSGELYRDEDYWVCVEKGDSIAEVYFDHIGFTNFVQTRNDYVMSGAFHSNNNEMCIDYDQLHSDAFSVFNIKDDTGWEILSYSHIVQNGIDHITMKYESVVDYDRGYDEIIKYRVDENGTIVYFAKGKRDIKTRKEKIYLEVTIGDGYGGGINYDDSDFAIPQPSDEVMDEYKSIYN